MPHRAGALALSPQPFESLRESSPSDQFHHERGHARAFFEPVNRGDVRMVQGRKHFRLALETREPIGVSGDEARQDFDRDLTLQLRVRRAIHLAHPAFADLRGDFVNAEKRAGSKGQR